MGARNYEVTVNTRAAATTLIQLKTVRLGDQIVPLIPIRSGINEHHLLVPAATVTNESLIRALTPYGQVTEVRNGTFKGQPSVLTGTRYIQMRIKEDNPVPNYIRVADTERSLTTPGSAMGVLALQTGGQHFHRLLCPYCERCGIYGHESTPCVLPCRRCRQAHATTSCEVPQLTGRWLEVSRQPRSHQYILTMMSSRPSTMRNQQRRPRKRTKKNPPAKSRRM
ncbi:hypothetical protein HPB48_016815 [Haemaphysalis longicornis]|uniref:CCHC-type domain-containing protein n=1 Tax=Haemaphysalis longicornis TaxID=44386 RepID=A0A9J6GIQ6_HAELO|nr:hypothetical protein HPB48_016815 [Haemaphysalis longicornis]